MKTPRQITLERLEQLPRELDRHEMHLCSVQEKLGVRKVALEQVEDALLLAEAITGRNEAVRQAELRSRTQAERQAVREMEHAVREAAARVRCLRDELGARKAMARLVASEEE